MMNRRQFLKRFGSLTAATAAGIILPANAAELFMPEKTIFLPPAGGWAKQEFIPRYVIRPPGFVVVAKQVMNGSTAREIDRRVYDHQNQLVRIEVSPAQPGDRLMCGHISYVAGTLEELTPLRRLDYQMIKS
jgi:hypothetical protein